MVDVDGLRYYVNPLTEECGVEDGSNCSGEVVINATITYENKQYPVTAIGYRAFSNCHDLTSVIIPNSVKIIRESAFAYCSNLSNIIIPNSVTDIDSEAFLKCSGLTSVTLSNSLTTIGNDVFSYCTALTSITIPAPITYIGSTMFCKCTGLTSVNIANSVRTIEAQAFSGCTSLTSITIPDSVESIGYGSFSGCRSLVSIEIGSGTKIIEDEVFYDCNALRSIKVDAQNPPEVGKYTFNDNHYDSAVLYVPKDSKELYETSWPWEYFLHIDTTDNYKPSDSGINEVELGDDEQFTIYNLNGVKIGDSFDGLPKGIYIVRHNSQISKIAI